MKRQPNPGSPWDAARIKALRRQLKLSQASMAERLGTRQQTVSEWETGQYLPRGASVAMLNILAERAPTPYQAVSSPPAPQVEGTEGRWSKQPSRKL